ncbi:TetR/AcrR family transcriptional regulator [Actinokineospora soli]
MTEAPAPTRRIRPRIVAAAIDLTARSGWSSVTMARLADAVGVSRQTVYNEVGSKPALAEAMVQTELAGFLAAVETAFESTPDSLVDAIRAAVRSVLDLAADNTLLHAIVSATHGAGTDLLPLLTTHADALLNQAKHLLTGHLSRYEVPFTDAELAVLIDVVVRAVLSHVMQPSADPAETADGVAWLVERLLSSPA